MKRHCVLFMLAIVLFAIMFSCGKDSKNPTRPEDQGYAVTLRYRSYYPHMGYYWGCIRLNIDNNHIDKCELGMISSNFWTRQYTWTLYVLDTRQEVETYIQVATGTVLLDRNKTCDINGSTITWF
jgi:hypothetical protein